MSTEYWGIIFVFVLGIILAIPLGRYIAKVFKDEKNLFDFMKPLEKLIFKFSGIDPAKEMNWKQHMIALLMINMIWFVFGFIILCIQGILPLNPDHNPSMTPDQAFHTVISFMVNCDQQHYSGETGLSYLSQLVVILFLMFGSATTGIAAYAVVLKALASHSTDKLGNFFNYFVKSITRIILPICVIIAIIFVFNGMPASFASKDTITTLEGKKQYVSRGPVAGIIAIKHLGTNGGGYYGANSAHPLENPNYLTNMVEELAQYIIPIALIFALGFYLKRRKLSYVIYGVMTAGFLMLVIPTIYYELKGNTAITNMGIEQSLGNMEGKEVRFGSISSAFWSILTTCIATGSVNSMHDSFMPISGMCQMIAMKVNSFYGGKGVGFLNYFVYIIITAFISGLMVGRTPELLGKR